MSYSRPQSTPQQRTVTDGGHFTSDNGGPTWVDHMLAKGKAIYAILLNRNLSQTEALVLIGLIQRSDSDYGNAFPGSMTVCQYAKVSKTQTIWYALKGLEDDHKVIKRRARGTGQSNVYQVVPDAVIAAVADELARL